MPDSKDANARTDHMPLTINGFDKSIVLTNLEVLAFIQESFPPNHLKRISEIRYVDKYHSLVGDRDLSRLLMTGLNVTSQWVLDSDGREIIELFRQETSGSTDAQRIRSDIAHEIGHSVYNQVTPREIEAYRLVWAAEASDGFNNRTANDMVEDFCEAYSLCFTNRAVLLAMAGNRYNVISAIDL